ncbi:MAG: GNAT family N-acetyltransferase [Eubacterium sp.]|nr:GNAT family N-acetyltransferase [Eubacterium sp.]
MRFEKLKKEDYPEAKRLYLEAFPPEERIAFRILKKRAEQNKADFFNIFTEDGCIGFVYLVTNESLVYINYFAIKKEYRGQGFGTKVIQTVLEKYKRKKIFLALEDWNEECDNKKERLKRRDFYQRCGLREFPYHLKEGTVIYSVMGAGEQVRPNEYKELMDNYFKWPLKILIPTEIIADL